MEVFERARALNAILVTADKGFSNVLNYPLGSHAGIIVLRVPNELPTQEVNRQLLRALADLKDENLTGLLVIIDAGRLRLRRPTS